MFREWVRGCVFSGRVDPTGEQKASRQDDFLNIFLPILTLGGEGVLENQQKTKTPTTKIRTQLICCYAGRFSQKKEGSTAERLLRFYANK